VLSYLYYNTNGNFKGIKITLASWIVQGCTKLMVIERLMETIPVVLILILDYTLATSNLPCLCVIETSFPIMIM